MRPPKNPSLETILRGLPLREPSPSVREALFVTAPLPGAPARPVLPPGPGPIQVWFAPLAASAVCALSAATVLLPSTGPGRQALAAALAADMGSLPVGQVERNAPPRPSFRSTTGAGVASSFGSLLLRQTNVLAR